MDKNFNTSYVVIKLFPRCLLFLQAHRFNTSYVVIKHILVGVGAVKYLSFNTSYVVIKRYLLWLFHLHLWVSIHLMLLLNDKTSTVAETARMFQYILCCY